MSSYDDLLSLGREFWAWRAINQPVTGDDIPRIERPSGWVPNWSKSFIKDNIVCQPRTSLGSPFGRVSICSV
jgi:hypothetical protein